MAVKKMFLLPNGFLDLDQSIMTAGFEIGVIKRVPAYSALIVTGNGLVLVDTGLNPDGLREPEKAWGDRVKVVKPSFHEEDDICGRLADLRFSVSDIIAVINTHLHWDHTGGNRFFSHCPIYVQQAEYRFALYPDHHLREAYMKNHFDYPLNYQCLEGDAGIVDGVSVLFTPGHTPGHQSVLVELPETGPLILAGDALYCLRSLKGPLPPGHCWSSLHAIQSIYRLKNLQDKFGCILLPGHEPSFWDHYQASPFAYS